ncbi:MAG: transglycosylase SLT domain-containing protein [Candidatus Zixiibacteriota bacterium]
MRRRLLIVRRRGMSIGWPMAAALVAAWVLPLVGFVHLARQNVALTETLRQQRAEFERQNDEITRLRERLRILEAIEDLQTRLSPDEAAHLARHVYDYSRRHRIDPLLLLAMIDVESSFRTRSMSVMGARGLLQLLPSTGRAVAARLGQDWPGDDGLFEPEFNLRLAATYLSDLIDDFGSVEKALVAYNHGEGAVRLRLSTGEPLPTGYVQRVLATYHWLQFRHASLPLCRNANTQDP